MDIREKTQDQGTVRLADYLRFIRERWWVILIVVVVFVGTTVVVTVRKTPQYQASAEVIHQTAGWETTLLGINSTFYYYAQKIPVDARLLASPDVAERAKTRIGSARSAAELLGMISVEPLAETETIRVRAVSPDPTEAAAIANGFVEAFVAVRKEDMSAALATAKSVLEQQIQAIPPAEQGGSLAASLQQRLQQLNIVADLAGSDYRILQSASVPGTPFTPHPLRDSLLALGIGLVTGIALSFLLEYLDTRLKDEESMERVFGLPVLASIPIVQSRWSRFVPGSSKAEVPPDGVGFSHGQHLLREPFMALRSNLQYFGMDDPLRMLMVTSALPRHGKTTVTVNLGLAMALAGQSVLLIECDLRRPTLHKYLGITNEVGLSSVLTGAAELSSAVQTVDLAGLDSSRPTEGDPRPAKAQGRLWALSAGPLPPNPGELIASKRMLSLLETAARASLDCVILDTPPVLLVADALALVQHVDGVLITVRLHEVNRDQAIQTRNLLERSGARMLGLIVGSDRRTRRGYYAYGYGHGQGYGGGDSRESDLAI